MVPLLAGMVLMIAGAARADDAGLVRATLSNGLRVVIVRNTLAPVVATSVNYLVGSDEAPKGFPGMAHAQEHMMFRGSPGLPADQLADLGTLMGGNFNADTRESVTQYLFTVPSNDLDVALHVEALRMKGVLDSQKDWDLERGAIEQEVAQDLSNPTYVLFAKLRAAFFAGTPYAHDALGTKESFDKTTAAMLKKFHDVWYAPNNAVLIVVGNLDPDATLAKVKALFGAIPAKKLPARPAIIPKSAASAPIHMETDSPNGALLVAMRMPGLDSPDYPALDVLADVLGSQRGDLYALVPEGKAIAAGFALDPLPNAGMGYAMASFTPGSDANAIEREVRAILAKIAKDGVPADLVAAAKLQERRQAEFEKNSISGLASAWADALALEGLNSPDEDIKRIEQVSVDDVNRVARTYLDLDHAISGVMIPQGSGKPVLSKGGFGGQESIALGEAKPTKLPDWASAALDHLTVPPATINPVVSTLPNGLTLIVQPEDVSDTVSIYGHVRNRPETEEPPGQEGVSRVLEELFSYGSETLDRIAFQQALDQIGADEDAGTDFEIQVLARDADRGAELLADNELHPALPSQAMEIIRDQIARQIAARNQSPAYIGLRSMRQALFPKDDPSLREATPDTVKALTLDQVRAYYRFAFRPDLSTILVIGKITPEHARSMIETYFGGWTANGPKPETDLPAAPNNRPSVVAVPDASRVQDSVALDQTMTLRRSDPDYYALQLGSAVLGGGFYSSRLSIDLRKNSGLVYSVSSFLQAGKTRSVYSVAYACDPANVTKASNIIVRELKAMQTSPVAAAELARAKALIVGEIPLDESSIDQIAGGLIRRWDIGLPLDEPTIAARHFIDLGPAEVQSAFQKWLRPDDLVQVSRGPNPS
jgi:zinc protease